MKKTITQDVLIRNATGAVEQLLMAHDVAKSIKITIDVDKISVPTISYSVNGLPLIAFPTEKKDDTDGT